MTTPTVEAIRERRAKKTEVERLTIERAVSTAVGEGAPTISKLAHLALNDPQILTDLQAQLRGAAEDARRAALLEGAEALSNSKYSSPRDGSEHNHNDAFDAAASLLRALANAAHQEETLPSSGEER